MNGDGDRNACALRRPAGAKADAWKGPYHDGRALLECLEMLETLGGPDER